MQEPSYYIEPVLVRLREYFVKDIGIELRPREAELVGTPHIELLSYSVLINLGGAIRGGFILSVDKEFGIKLLELFSEVEIALEDRHEFIGEALAESLNIIIGNSCHLIPTDGEKIVFSPPFGLSKTSAIENYKHAYATKGEFESAYGKVRLIYIDYSTTVAKEQ
jgi:CheY-specific phosphatase CheX